MRANIICGFDDVFTFDTETISVGENIYGRDENAYYKDKDAKYKQFVRDHGFCAANGHVYDHGEGFHERVYDLYLRLCGAGLV